MQAYLRDQELQRSACVSCLDDASGDERGHPFDRMYRCMLAVWSDTQDSIGAD